MALAPQNPVNFDIYRNALSPAAFNVLTNSTLTGLGGRLFNNPAITSTGGALQLLNTSAGTGIVPPLPTKAELDAQRAETIKKLKDSGITIADNATDAQIGEAIRKATTDSPEAMMKFLGLPPELGQQLQEQQAMLEQSLALNLTMGLLGSLLSGFVGGGFGGGLGAGLGFGGGGFGGLTSFLSPFGSIGASPSTGLRPSSIGASFINTVSNPFSSLSGQNGFLSSFLSVLG